MVLKNIFCNSSMHSPCHFYYWILIKSTNSVIKITWWSHGGISKIFFLDRFSSSFFARNAKISPIFHFDRGHQSWICHILCAKKSMVYVGTEYFGSFLVVTILLSPYNLSVTSIVSSYPKFTYLGKGSLNNYVDIILSFFDHLPTSTWTLVPWRAWTWTKLGIFDHLPTYLTLSIQFLNDP